MTSKRRGGGEGSIYKETVTDPQTKVSHTYWVATIEAGRDPITGKRLRRKVKAKTRLELTGTKDTPGKIAKARAELAAGLVTGTGTTSLEAFLRRWLATVVTNRVASLNTLASYNQVVEKHIVPALGKTSVAKLSADQVDAFLQAKADSGLSRSYVGRMRSVLTDALTHAERRGIVTRNVGRLSVMPKCRPTVERRSLTGDEARQLLDAASGERLEALIAVGLMLGLRPGELTGLLWSDLDLDGKPPTLTVSGAMKRQPRDDAEKGYELVRGKPKRSTSGRRTVGLPMDLTRRLREHRARQAADRLAIADLWEDHGLVFCSEVGTPLDPSNVRRTFARVATAAGLDARFPYMLRHTAASLLIDDGVPVEQVADLLGDDPRTLYKHYRHRVRPVVDAATGPMEALFGARPVDAAQKR